MTSFTQKYKEHALQRDADLVPWARNLKAEYGPQLDYFVNNGGPVEKKLAQKVLDLAGVEA